MSKLGAAVWGGAMGALGAMAVSYLLGPARDTTYDEQYESRLDRALAEGKRAGAAREQEMLEEFTRLKQMPAPKLKAEKKDKKK